ncbi:hypothetical protein LB506_008493 [Fusarium annulatum]|nr:hypothetical protein LB506_008493 [Fusarium annulatum]
MSFASPWESMLAQAGLGGLQFSQAIPAMQANAVFAAAGGPFQNLVRRLEVFRQKVAMQDAFLRSGVKENLSMSINRLETASLHAEEFLQLQREIERALEQTKMDWENDRRQLEQYQHYVERCSRQLEDASNALRQVQDNVPDIGNDIGKAFFLPVLQATADALNTQSAALLAGFTELREKATQLALVMNDMWNGARNTGSQSWDKGRFVEGILRLCQMALIDGRACDEVETITTEISSGYSGQVPGSVADLLTKVGQFARDVAQKSISA